jgi:hypothetical protein
MVQFYRPIILNQTTQAAADTIAVWVDPRDYIEEKGLLSQADKDSKFVATIEMMLSDAGKYRGGRLVWAGDYAYEEPGADLNLYKMCSKDTQICPEESEMSCHSYLVNHTKRQFVSKERAEKYTNLHPLPMLTVETSNFASVYPRDHALLGYWARDSISVEKKRPDGYVEIIFDLA